MDISGSFSLKIEPTTKESVEITDEKTFVVNDVAIPMISKANQLSILDEKFRSFSPVVDLIKDVEKYNNNPNEENLDTIIHQLRFLKKHLTNEVAKDSLVHITNETILLKTNFLFKKTPFSYEAQCAQELKQLPQVISPSESFVELKKIIEQHNKEKNVENGLQVVKALNHWVTNHPDESFTYCNQAHDLIRQISCGLKDEELYLLFNLLQGYESVDDQKKMFWLRHQVIKLDPQLFHRYSLKILQSNVQSHSNVELRDNITAYYTEKTLFNFEKVCKSLIEWQFQQPREFSASNASRILTVLEQILQGKKLQDVIKESQSCLFLQRIEKLSKELSSCTWSTLSHSLQNNVSRSKSLNSLILGVDNFNRRSNSRHKFISSVIKCLLNWIDSEPEEFERCQGYEFLNALNEKALYNLFVQDFDSDRWSKSVELQFLYFKIQGYNLEKSLASFLEIIERLDTWERLQPQEFILFQGALFKDQLTRINRDDFKYLPILLPNSHPKRVIEKTLNGDHSNDLNCYILSFPQPIALWSHTELAFVKKKPPRINESDSANQSISQNEVDFLYKGILNAGGDCHSNSYNADGVQILGERLIARMETLANKRQRDIDNVNINIFAGVMPGLLSFKGEFFNELSTEIEKIRHLRNALIDNFVTNVKLHTLFPDITNRRYSVELYKSGNEIHYKWISDSNGKFDRIKNPVSLEVRYQRNGYFLGQNGYMFPSSKYDNWKLKTHEIGNVIKNADGSLEWKEDPVLGQYYKPKGDSVEKAKPDNTYLLKVNQLESILSGGESEYCTTFALRILHSAYAYVYLPQFTWLLESLEKAFYQATDFKYLELNTIVADNNTPSLGTKYCNSVEFQGRTLFKLADHFAKKMLNSNAGKAYFRDMNSEIKINNRITPDMLLKALKGKSPGIINTIGRSLQTMRLTKPRDWSLNWKGKVCFAGTSLLIGTISLPSATIKLAYNTAAATVALLPDIVHASKKAYAKKQAELEREKESLVDIEKPNLQLAKATIRGFLVDGFGKRLVGDYFGVNDIKESCSKKANQHSSPFRLK